MELQVQLTNWRVCRGYICVCEYTDRHPCMYKYTHVHDLHTRACTCSVILYRYEHTRK